MLPLYHKITITLLILSFALLVAAITQKAFVMDNGQPPADGSALFFMGWMGIFYGGAGICWLANPAWLASLLLMKNHPLLAIGCSVLAVIFALLFLCFRRMIANEGGGYANITGYRAGYWLWLSCMVVLLGGNILWYFTQRPAA